MVPNRRLSREEMTPPKLHQTLQQISRICQRGEQQHEDVPNEGSPPRKKLLRILHKVEV